MLNRDVGSTSGFAGAHVLKRSDSKSENVGSNCWCYELFFSLHLLLFICFVLELCSVVCAGMARWLATLMRVLSALKGPLCGQEHTLNLISLFWVEKSSRMPARIS